MNRALTLAVTGWLLAVQHYGVIAMYDTKSDCEFAAKYAPEYGFGRSCIPDRFTVEELRAQETKP